MKIFLHKKICFHHEEDKIIKIYSAGKFDKCIENTSPTFLLTADEWGSYVRVTLSTEQRYECNVRCSWQCRPAQRVYDVNDDACGYICGPRK